jgi:hypothetical protein
LWPTVPAARTEPDRKRNRPDECATLRAECEKLRELASEAKTKAAQAALEAEAAHADHVLAMRTSEEARRRHEALVREGSEISAEVAVLEPNRHRRR